MPDFEKWLADDGAVLRDWLTDGTPELLHGLIDSAPLWGRGLLPPLRGLP